MLNLTPKLVKNTNIAPIKMLFFKYNFHINQRKIRYFTSVFV